MKKFKKIKILILIFISIIILQTTSLASSLELEAKTDKTSVELEEEFTISLSIENIESTTGVNAIQGNIEYDYDIFEFVKVEQLNNWSFNYNDQNDGKFVAMVLSKGEKENQDIAKIVFKLKQNINNDEQTIRIKNIKSSDEYEKISIQDKEIKINIAKIQDNKQKEKSENDTEVKQKNNNVIYSICFVFIILFLIFICVIIKHKVKK